MYRGPLLRLNARRRAFGQRRIVARQQAGAQALKRHATSFGEDQMHWSRHLKLCGLAAVGIVLGVGFDLAFDLAPASAQDKTFELKLSHWVPPSHPLQKAMEDWGASIEKDSSGTIKYKVYPAQQLGKAFDHYDMARDGIADLTYVNPGYQPGRFPVIAAGELPFLVSEARGGSQALDA